VTPDGDARTEARGLERRSVLRLTYRGVLRA
jgi:hypothetical protein